MDLHNNRGFTALEALLMLIFLAIIGFSGYYVWCSQHTGNHQAIPVSSKNPEHQKQPANQIQTMVMSYDGERMDSAQGGFSVLVPDGWTLRSFAQGNKLYQYDVSKLVYDDGHQPIVNNDIEGGVGGYVPGMVIEESDYATKPGSPTTTLALKDGTEGSCAETTTTEPTLKASGDWNVADGEFVAFDCYFDKQGKKLQASYAYWQKNPLDAQLAKKVIKSIEIK